MKTKLTKIIMSSLAFAGASVCLAATVALSTSGTARAATDAHCDAHVLRGTYGIHIQGTRPVPPPQGGGTEDVIGVVIRTYDGMGNFTQIDNVKGSVTGIVPDRPGSGTYQVNQNCTAVTQTQPGPGILIEEKMVIVDLGNETHSITATTTPPGIMVSASGKRMDRR